MYCPRSVFSALCFVGFSAGARATWVAYDIHPTASEAINSRAYGMRNNKIVGSVDLSAALWTIGIDGFVGLGQGIATNTDGVEQVGSRNSQGCAWQGTAASFVSLLPNLTATAAVNGCYAGQEVGGTYSGFSTQTWKATIWAGSAASYVLVVPPGTDYSVLQNTYAGQHVGGFHPIGALSVHPGIWTGTSTAVVDLMPAGCYEGNLYGVYSGQQCGYFLPYASSVGRHAGLWTNTALSVVDLSPAGYTNSVAYAIYGDNQAGTVETPAKHAAFWEGSAATFVDLHSVLPPGFVSSEANGVWTDSSNVYTYASGYAVNTLGNKHAFLWKRIPDQMLNGTLNLLDTTGVFAFGRTINYRVEKGTSVIASGTVVSNTTNTSFAIPVMFTHTGAARLYFDGASFLQRRVNVTLSGSSQSVGVVAVSNGDPDLSGEVDAADIDLVISNFGFVGDSLADVDESGEVDAADIDVTIASFGATDQL